MSTLPQEGGSQGPQSFMGKLCSRDLPHILRHSPLSKEGRMFSLLTSEISSDHIRDDPPWPDPLSPGCGCPTHSGKGACVHPKLILIFLPLWSSHKHCVLLAVCKTEWQYCLNPLWFQVQPSVNTLELQKNTKSKILIQTRSHRQVCQ